jgi:3-hydroxyisobutyrate dehydrogenase-like beta-hydroxyacid dehydrogenase
VTSRIGLIGVGEAGAAIAAGLHEEHARSVAAFDARGGEPEVRSRAERAGIDLAGSLEALAASSDVVICLTSAKVAVAVARDMVPFLTAEHVYTDWNSASPQLKCEVAEVVAPSGARFADGAVMAAVPAHRHRVPVLLSGDGAPALQQALAGMDMQLEVLGPEPGQASAVKMFRSLLVKGLEALLLECAVGANAYGATHRVLESMTGSLPTQDWPELAAYLLQRTVAHGERRAEELRQVARTLEDVGLEPLLADAGARRLQWFVDLDVTGGVASHELDYPGVLSAIEKARS